jgi:hypothetical protein
LTATVYKNNEVIPWSSLGAITWHYKTNTMQAFASVDLDNSLLFTRVTSGIDYIVNLDYRNFNSIQIYFTVEEAST